ncbi:integrin alpha-PS1 [Trichonephila clavipes]|nr:integrin alpha-PS1 [Trichonephila clavipes]
MYPIIEEKLRFHRSHLFADLAIGAPYEEKGVIYIYLGSENGLITEPSQIIKVENLAKEVRVKRELNTFGYSLSGGIDLDNNGYPDLLVGAYESDSIILLRSRPIIDIITHVEGNISSIDPKQKGCIEDRNSSLVCFSFEACFQFNSSVLSHGTYIKIRYRIEAETFTGKKYYRTKFKSSLDSETPNIVEKELVIRGVSLYDPHCSRQLVYLKEKTDIQTPIKFKLTYTLIQKEPKMSKEGENLPDINSYPILNQQEASKVFEAKFLKDCGANDICESDLHVTAELNLPKQESGVPVLYLGEQQVNLSITLYNHKEPAYDASLYVFHPNTLSYIGRKVVRGEPIECVPHNSTVLKCEIGNPMNKGEVEFQLRFSPRNVSDDEKQLKFILKANTTSIEVMPEDDFELTADIVRVAELELRGVSNPEQVVYGEHIVDQEDMKTGEDVGSLIMHTYELINYGPWKAKQVEVHIKWPYQTETFTKNGKWLLYMMEAPKVQGNGFCDVDPDIINPLRLQVKREEDQFIREFEGESSKSEARVKRQAPEEIRLERPLNIATMDCEEGTAKCHYFKCYIRDVLPDKNALISIRARLWSQTFVEDYATVDRVDIISRASIYLDPQFDIRQKTENDRALAITKALPDLPLYQKPEEVPLWIIILAVCGGLLLLILLIFCLWKLGFFKRKKPGYMPAELHEKEREFNGSAPVFWIYYSMPTTFRAGASSFAVPGKELINVYCYLIQPCCSEECLTTQRGSGDPFGLKKHVSYSVLLAECNTNSSTTDDQYAAKDFFSPSPQGHLKHLLGDSFRFLLIQQYDYGISSDDTKYSALVANLDAETLSYVSDIVLSPPNSDKYHTLSQRLITQFSDSETQKIKKLLTDLQLGDEKPSHLLRK